jgi:hypothetical protein
MSDVISVDAFIEEKEKLLSEFAEASSEYVEAKDKARLLEDSLKSVYAECYRKCEGSVKDKEMEAYADKTYREHVAAMNSAQALADAAYYRMEAARRRLDLFQSQWSFMRTLISGGG